MPALSGPDTIWEERDNRWQPVERVKSWKNTCMDWLTKYRIFRIALLNWVIIVIYAAFLARLTWRFKALYQQRALITMMVTNLLLYGLADTLAQTLGSMVAFSPEQEQPSAVVKWIVQRGRPRRVILDEEDDDLLELGLDEDYIEDQPRHRAKDPEVFYFRRLALFTVWGFILSFVQSPWYGFLNSINEENKFLSVLKRVLIDQLGYTPLSLLAFFTYTVVVMEGGNQDAVIAKVKKSYLPTMAINYMVWPAAQFFNFLVMPSPMQIPFSSTVGVFWNAYLSLQNASS